VDLALRTVWTMVRIKRNHSSGTICPARERELLAHDWNQLEWAAAGHEQRRQSSVIRVNPATAPHGGRDYHSSQFAPT
jgi:hypothetical protein